MSLQDEAKPTSETVGVIFKNLDQTKSSKEKVDKASEQIELSPTEEKEKTSVDESVLPEPKVDNVPFESPKAEDVLMQSRTRRTIYDPPVNETGWDRLRAMYMKDELGSRSGELGYVIQGAAAASLVGVIFGGVSGGRQSMQDFIAKNESTQFYGELDGRRRLNDQVMFGSMRNALRWGAKLGFFTGAYLLTVMSIAVYRNKSSLLEYAAGGGITGALYKFNLGLKGMCAGGIFGSALGSLAGVTSLTTMWLSGTSMEEIRYWRNIRKMRRQSEVYNQILKNRTDKEVDALSRAHQENVKAG